MGIPAAYYDGHSARRHEVSLTVAAGVLILRGQDFERSEALPALNIPPPLGNTPRVILFADGARCEVTDQAEFAALMAAAGHNPSLVSRMEASWRYALAALLVTLGVVAATYVWGLPYAAGIVAKRVPASMTAMIDQQFFLALDQRLLHPSKLPAARQQAIASRMQRLRLPPDAVRPTRIEFRSSPEIGPNAFALPGGSVVILDELVKLSGNDDEIVGVLAHEMGHVSERHALRQMLQASVVGLAMAWYVGDISNLLAAAPTTLLETRYSRDFERRADAFAARMLTLNNIPSSRLADMLAKLERSHGSKVQGKEKNLLDYFSTHPDTDERIQALRGAG